MSGKDLYEYFRSGERLPPWEDLSSDIKARWNYLVAETLWAYATLPPHEPPT